MGVWEGKRVIGGGLWLSGREKEREEEGLKSDDSVKENCLC